MNYATQFQKTKRYIYSLWFKTKSKLVSEYESLTGQSLSPETIADLMKLKRKQLIAKIKELINQK